VGVTKAGELLSQGFLNSGREDGRASILGPRLRLTVHKSVHSAIGKAIHLSCFVQRITSPDRFQGCLALGDYHL
jgi:hypothetical protein